MKSVLISIRSQWCEKIASGKKTIEVRKSAPKEVPFKAYIYCTKDKTYLYRVDDDNNFELTNTLRPKTYEYVKDYSEKRRDLRWIGSLGTRQRRIVFACDKRTSTQNIQIGQANRYGSTWKTFGKALRGTGQNNSTYGRRYGTNRTVCERLCGRLGLLGE